MLERACADGAWGAINEAHAGCTRAIVAAADSPRIEAAHAALSGELQLFLNQLEPLWSAERMAADHAALVRGLERDGPAVLRGTLASRRRRWWPRNGTPAGGRVGGPPPGRRGESDARSGDDAERLADCPCAVSQGNAPVSFRTRSVRRGRRHPAGPACHTSTAMTRRFDIGPFVLALRRSCCLSWLACSSHLVSGAAFNAWDVFELTDLLLAALAIAGVVAAVGL